MTDDEARALLGRMKMRGNDAERAYAIFHKGFANYVHRVASRILRTREDLEEVVVDTLFVVWKRAGDFEGRSTVKTWVTGIAENKALEVCRKNKNHWTNVPESDAEVNGGGIETMPSDDDLLELLERSQNAGFVRRCIDKLSFTHRSIVMLRFDGDKSEQDISKIMGIPLGSVKSGFFYAKGQLRTCLQGSTPGEK